MAKLSGTVTNGKNTDYKDKWFELWQCHPEKKIETAMHGGKEVDFGEQPDGCYFIKLTDSTQESYPVCHSNDDTVDGFSMKPTSGNGGADDMVAVEQVKAIAVVSLLAGLVLGALVARRTPISRVRPESRLGE